MAEAVLNDVAVIVVNFGSSAILTGNLAPLTRQHPELLAVVVDNFSDRAEQLRIGAVAAAESWVLESSERNDGFGAGVNRGARIAINRGRRYLLLLNPDASITADTVQRLRNAVVAEPFALVAPVVLRPDGSTWSAGSDLYLRDGRVRSRRRRQPGSPIQEWLSGACLLLSVELWQTVDGFDERYFLYWEDVDLSWKVRAAGGELRLLKDLTAIHEEGGTQGAGLQRAGQAKSSTYYYFNIRNRLLFAALRLAPEDGRRWLQKSPRVAMEVLLQGGRRQFLHPSRTVLVAVRATLDGRREMARIHRVNA